FRSAFAQNRGLDFKESLRIEKLPSCLGDAMAGLQIAGEARSAQIEIAIGQLEIFIAQFGIELKREILGAIQNRERLREHFDVAGRQLWVFGARQTRGDFSANLNDVFRTQAVGLLCYFSVFFRSKDHLSQSLAI